MTLGVLILGIDRVGERSDGIEDRLRQGIGAIRDFRLGGLGGGQRIGELPEPLVDLVKGFRPGRKQALEGDAKIGLEHVAFPAFGLVGIDVIRRGNRVTALMLGKVHRSVGDLNEFLWGRAVQGIGGDAETRADILFAKQGIGGDPATQLGGELARLLHGGFGHENDEFISAIAGHHVGAAAVGFENLADALQDQITFEVAIEVVHKLKAVEVHEHQGKGTARARGTLPFRRQRFHEKTVSLDACEAVGDGLFLSLLERQCVVVSAGDQVGKGVKQQGFLVGNLDAFTGFHIEDAVKVFAIENGQGHGCYGIRQQRLSGALGILRRAKRSGLASARYLTDQAGIERDTPAHGTATLAALGSNHQFAGRVIKQSDTDVVVSEAGLQLFCDFRQNFIGIEGGDRIARDHVQEAEVARFGSFFLEKAGVFNGDTSFASEYAQNFEMTFVVGAFFVGEEAQRADRVIVSDEGDTAERASGANRLDAQFADFVDEILANQNRLARPQYVFGQVIARRPRSLCLAYALDGVEFEMNQIAGHVVGGKIDILSIEQSAQFLPDFAEEIFLVEGGTESAADFIQDMQLFGAAGGLLNQIAVFHGHADLMSQGQEQTQFRGRKAAIVRGAEEKQAKGLFFGLQTDDND